MDDKRRGKKEGGAARGGERSPYLGVAAAREGTEGGLLSRDLLHSMHEAFIKFLCTVDFMLHETSW